MTELRTKRGLFGGMGLLLLTLVMTGIAALAGSRGSEMKVPAKVRVPELIAIRFHHDMCPYCKKLAPEFDQKIRDGGTNAILYLTIDLSTPSTQQQSALLAGALGLETLWTGDLSRIGTVVFVDGSSKRELLNFRSNEAQSLEQAEQKALSKLRDTK